MTKKQKRHIIATAGTIVFLALVFLILWYVYLSAPVSEQEEGIEVEFAEWEEEPIPADFGEAAYAEEPTDAAPAAPASPAEVATDPNPSSPAEHILSEEETLALARAKKEQEEREAAERARKQKEAEAIANANALGNLFGKTNGTNTSGDGTGQGAGQKGNPAGHGNVGGNSWSLAGRDIKGTFPIPEKGKYVPGKVVIEIRVNPQGQVVSARETTGGNISDPATIEAMLKKAREVQFTPLNQTQDQIGYITYIIPD